MRCSVVNTALGARSAMRWRKAEVSRSGTGGVTGRNDRARPVQNVLKQLLEHIIVDGGCFGGQLRSAGGGSRINDCISFLVVANEGGGRAVGTPRRRGVGTWSLATIAISASNRSGRYIVVDCV
jgi:hypothetical protein